MNTTERIVEAVMKAMLLNNYELFSADDGSLSDIKCFEENNRSIICYDDSRFQRATETIRTAIASVIGQEKVKIDLGESIQCVYCEGRGCTDEHTNHSPEEPCTECPIQLPCGYCYGAGRITYDLMKGHMTRKVDEINEDELPF